MIYRQIEWRLRDKEREIEIDRALELLYNRTYRQFYTNKLVCKLTCPESKA